MDGYNLKLLPLFPKDPVDLVDLLDLLDLLEWLESFQIKAFFDGVVALGPDGRSRLILFDIFRKASCNQSTFEHGAGRARSCRARSGTTPRSCPERRAQISMYRIPGAHHNSTKM